MVPIEHNFNHHPTRLFKKYKIMTALGSALEEKGAFEGSHLFPMYHDVVSVCRVCLSV